MYVGNHIRDLGHYFWGKGSPMKVFKSRKMVLLKVKIGNGPAETAHSLGKPSSGCSQLLARSAHETHFFQSWKGYLCT